jgi:hypothetical protein
MVLCGDRFESHGRRSYEATVMKKFLEWASPIAGRKNANMDDRTFSRLS